VFLEPYESAVKMFHALSYTRAMPLSEVQHQPRAVEALKSALKSGSVHHAWLLHGPDGVGKELAGICFAQALTCPEKPMVGCGVCSSCKRVKGRNHPDVTWVLPEDEQVQRGLAGRSDFDHTPSRDIRIEQVRALGERLSFRPLEAKHKVALLVNAHAMNASAQNALLKTLEEPPRDTILVLISSAIDKLLPTIRSRCTKAQFGPLPVDFIAAQLKLAKKKISPEDATQAAAMAGGSLKRAMELDADALGVRRDVIERFEALVPGDARAWLAFAEVFGDGRANAELCLDVLSVWFRDVAVAQVGQGGLINADLAALAEAAAARVSPASLHRRATVLDEARNAITQRNGAVRLQLERMLIEMLTV
jgi:DNA polymerase III subunit delta'